MPQPQLIFQGSFTAENISFTSFPSQRKIDPELEQLCIQEWEKRKLEASQNNQLVWDSDVYRFESVQVSNSELNFSVSTIPFSTRISMNKYTSKIDSLGLDYAPLGMFSSCIVFTSDNQLLYLKKSSKYQTTRNLVLIGGILSQTELPIHSGADLFNHVFQELKEETGISKDQVSSTVLKAGYVTENYNFCLVFDIKLSISYDQVINNFQNQPKDEIQEILKIPLAEISSLIKILPPKDHFKFQVLGLTQSENNVQ